MEPQPVYFQFDDVEVNVRDAQVFKAGQRVAIEPKAFRVLVYLLERPGRLVEKEELLSALWPNTFVTENALTRSIALLRKVLGDAKGEAKYIETVPTRGYRFIAPVTTREAPAAAVHTTEPGPAPKSAGPTSRRLAWAALVLAAAAAAVFLTITLKPHKQAPPAEYQALQVTNSTALDGFPSFSPDGNTVAYSSNENGALEIYLKQLTRGGSEVQLTLDGGQNTQPAWSPDGATIAYYSASKGGIWLIPALGGVARQLTPFGSSPAWSPDGTQLAFESEGSVNFGPTASVSISAATLWIASTKDGTLRQLTQVDRPDGAHNSPAWSPDGKSIAFVTAGFQNPGLWTISVSDGRLRRIAHGSFFDPIYSPDGSYLYVTTQFGLWKVPLNGAQREREPERVKIADTLPETWRYLAISRDGLKIAFSRIATSSNIYSLPMSGDRPSGPPVPLTHDTRLRKTNPVVSFDGRQVLFEVGSIDRNGGVWVMDADGKNSKPVLVPCEDPKWLPGNREFLCADFVKATRPDCKSDNCWAVDILKVDLVTGTQGRILHIDQDGAFFDYSNDGTQVAFMSIKSGAPNTWVAQVSGGPPRQVTFDKTSMGFPSWSPDGKLLAVEQKLGDSSYIWTVKPGEAPIQVTRDRGQNWPSSFSPDGSKIAFAAQRDGVWNLWFVSRRDGSEKQLTSYRDTNEYVRYPGWSPDGRSMVYEYAEITGNIWVLELK